MKLLYKFNFFIFYFCDDVLVASSSESEIHESLTPIESNKGMIYTAGKTKRSLIKSLNYDHHFPAIHDHIWGDYITIIFDSFYDQDKPYISLGISVKNKSKHGNNLYYLNYCKIENIIQDYIVKIDQKCKIIETIKNIKETIEMAKISKVEALIKAAQIANSGDRSREVIINNLIISAFQSDKKNNCYSETIILTREEKNYLQVCS
jgi:hypothetical protein